MKRRKESKASLVDFLRSIKFAHDNSATNDASPAECSTHFAHFKQRARGASESSIEDSQLIRSAN